MNTITIFGSLLFLLTLAVILQQRKIRSLRADLGVKVRDNAQIINYLGIFAENITKSGDGESTEWIEMTAQYLAEQIHAEEVCIFLNHEGKFRATGKTKHFPDRLAETIECDPCNLEQMDTFRKKDKTLQDVAFATVCKGESNLWDCTPDSDYDHLLRRERINDFMCLPLINEGVLIGMVYALNRSDEIHETFSREKLTRMEILARPVILAHNFLKVYKSLSTQQRLVQELDFIRNLQRSLLPKSIPEWGDFEIHASSIAAREVSGDFYDFVQLDRDRILVMVGDASGKGLPACLVMSMARSYIRANIAHFTSLKNLMYELNTALYRDLDDERYLTLAICLLNKRENTLEYVRAAHPPVIMYVRNHTRCIEPEGMAIGMLPPEFVHYDSFITQFGSQMGILMYTDGINEATNPEGVQYGEKRIEDIFRENCRNDVPPEQTIRQILTGVSNYAVTDTDLDDRTIVVITPKRKKTSPFISPTSLPQT